MTTVEVLRKAREFVATGWTQRTYAKDANGLPCDPDSSVAICRCALGAIFAAGLPGQFMAVERALEAAIPTSFGRGNLRVVSAFNDSKETTQADVVAAFDRAIAAQEAQS